ncbi:hypothetical protein K0M31_014392 [Melipona bicolor]|uniref:Uncharacterized protein n=1 Tax=Melipona bicolor TaxID=60889 RepID=A0AA40G8G7_9HYME|nr:hypothetical protein K0M31_014392 [Melipona bicolor]
MEIRKCAAQGHVTLQQTPNPLPLNIVILTPLTDSSGCMYLVDSGAAEGVGASHPPVARVGERGGVHRIVDPPLPVLHCVYRFISCFLAVSLRMAFPLYVSFLPFQQ